MDKFFSVIMPSYLGKYRKAAKNRENKIIWAINSCLNQSFRDFELIVVADGCEKTLKTVSHYYTHINDYHLRLLYVEKQPNFSGMVRNAGIKKAYGDYILYLDVDDVFLEGHLQVIHDGIMQNPDYDWYYFDDYSYNQHKGRFDRHGINIDEKGKCGTSNICHRRDMGVYWPIDNTYLHDWIFITRLKAKSRKAARLPDGRYGICHVPNLLDVEIPIDYDKDNKFKT